MRYPIYFLKEEQQMAGKPSEKEEEYFARKNFESKKKLEEERHKKLGVPERVKLKDLHYMRCPKCGMELIEINYNGIQTGKCSECEGVWFDAGEFEALSKTDQSMLIGLFRMFAK